MGTPDFAVSALRALVEDGQDVVLVLTQPDRPKGRGYELQPSPVRAYADANGIRTETPLSLRDGQIRDLLQSCEADFFIVAAYGKILPKEILDIPALGCVNLHASLLPAWRGAAPIQRAVMNGDATGGVTVMKMDEGMDTGDILMKREIPIGPDTTAGEYHDELAREASSALIDFLRASEKGPVPSVPQTGDATYAPKIDKEEGRVTFLETALQTHNRIRGLSPFPGAFSFLNGKRVKLLGSAVGRTSGRAKDAEPGTVLSAGPAGLEVQCADGTVLLTCLQAEGKAKTDGASFANGLRSAGGKQVFHG